MFRFSSFFFFFLSGYFATYIYCVFYVLGGKGGIQYNMYYNVLCLCWKIFRIEPTYNPYEKHMQFFYNAYYIVYLSVRYKISANRNKSVLSFFFHVLWYSEGFVYYFFLAIIKKD